MPHQCRNACNTEDMQMVDDDGAPTFGGMMMMLFLIVAPILLGIALLKLFFRAPLAAILGGLFCAFLAWLGVVVFNAIIADMHPMGMIAVLFLGFFAAAGACYGLASADNVMQYFSWECAIIEFALTRCGLAGRVFYMFVQTIPGLLLALLLSLGLYDMTTTTAGVEEDFTVFWVICGWLAISQVVVYRFHRTTHPIGQFATFDGRPRQGLTDEEVGLS
jgi:TctA family transporter